jgi:hypothetical protein
MKSKGMTRRQLMYGFCASKDTQGQVTGSSVLRLARRNAYEMVGLRRPAGTPVARWKAT